MKCSLKYKPLHVYGRLSIFVEPYIINKHTLTARMAPSYEWKRSECPWYGIPENGKQIPFGGYIWKEYMCGWGDDC